MVEREQSEETWKAFKKKKLPKFSLDRYCTVEVLFHLFKCADYSLVELCHQGTKHCLH